MIEFFIGNRVVSVVSASNLLQLVLSFIGPDTRKSAKRSQIFPKRSIGAVRASDRHSHAPKWRHANVTSGDQVLFLFLHFCILFLNCCEPFIREISKLDRRAG